jgi:carbon storage regulator
MLVLGRKVGEKIVIAEDVVVTVLATRGNQVKVGIEAPGWLRVTRAELLNDSDDAPSSLPRRSR